MAPPQPTRPSPFHFENLNASSSAGAQSTVTRQFIHLVDQGQGVAASMNQQNVPSANENDIQQMGLGLRDDYWTYVKKLERSDVDGQCRLLLEKSFVENHILHYRIDAGQCSSADGIPIAVWDADESCGFHLTLKQRPITNSYVLYGGWIPDFVKRKGLQEGDEVGLTYLGSTSTLYFKHLKLN